jgi:hypothetical protein
MYFYNFANCRFYILQQQLRNVLGNFDYIDQNGSILNYTFSKSVIYLWFYMYTPEDGHATPKFIVFLIWYNKQIYPFVYAM